MRYIIMLFKWTWGLLKWAGDGLKRGWNHLHDFSYIWILLLGLFVASICSLHGEWEVARIVVWVAIVFIFLLFVIRPMNAVYGLMGTSGSIRLFFFNFVLITLLFAKVYHYGFFKDAGISYDVNQPHIDYNYYAKKQQKEVVLCDTAVYKKCADSTWHREIVVQETKLNYQPIGFWYIWRNTIMTALMQEPTDFFAAASTYNESIVDSSLSKKEQVAEITLDKQKTMMFHWILIFQILISWIFFGVFISLLYNKFRYES